MSQTGEAFEKLVTVMRTLRSPDGCPWDREQTLESLTRFVLEEAHEVVDAIERGNMDDLREEIGDHIFEGVFLAQVAADRGLFTVDDSLRTVVDKLVRRHPHVFQDDGRVHDAESLERAPSADAALERWNSLKAQERAGVGERRTTLGSVPKGLPSLLRAHTIGKRVASVGFEWPTTAEVVTKIEEEVAELRETLDHEPGNAARAEEEMGDLLFAIANLSRKLGIEPETALRKANEKFTKRFNQLEENFARDGRDLEASTLEEMEAEWQRIKAQTAYIETRRREEHEDHDEIRSERTNAPESFLQRRAAEVHQKSRPGVGWLSDRPAPEPRARASSSLDGFQLHDHTTPNDEIEPMSPNGPVAILDDERSSHIRTESSRAAARRRRRSCKSIRRSRGRSPYERQTRTPSSSKTYFFRLIVERRGNS